MTHVNFFDSRFSAVSTPILMIAQELKTIDHICELQILILRYRFSKFKKHGTFVEKENLFQKRKTHRIQDFPFKLLLYFPPRSLLRSILRSKGVFWTVPHLMSIHVPWLLQGLLRLCGTLGVPASPGPEMAPASPTHRPK